MASASWVLLLFIIGSDGKTHRDNNNVFAWDYSSQIECQTEEMDRQKRNPNHEYVCVNKSNNCMTNVKQGTNRRIFAPECLRERY